MKAVRQPGELDVPFKTEAELLHHSQRGPIVRQRPGGNLRKLQPLEADRENRLGHLGGQALSPLFRSDGVSKPVLLPAVDPVELQSSSTNESSLRPVAEDPEPEPMPFPMFDRLGQPALGLLVGQNAAIGRKRPHNFGIIIKATEVSEVVRSDPLGLEAIGEE